MLGTYSRGSGRFAEEMWVDGQMGEDGTRYSRPLLWSGCLASRSRTDLILHMGG